METERVNLAPVSRRTALAFWILGLCNNYGYVVMLSAAYTIIKGASYFASRQCNPITTGAVLLADIIPALLIKIVAPFFPLFIHFRLAIVICFNVIGFVLVSQGKTIAVTLSGVAAISFGSGLGEVSILAYLAFYQNRSTISSWSSGTGGAGIFGALSYLLLDYVYPPEKYGLDVLLIFLVVPVIMAVAFWVLLEHPVASPDNAERPFMASDSLDEGYDDNIIDVTRPDPEVENIPNANVLTISDKIYAAPRVLKFMLPFTLVYLFEYFINQGLLDLIYFHHPMNHNNQYVSYQLCYQTGVFFSRSSLGFFPVSNTWLLAALQSVNVVVFLTEAIYSYLPNIGVLWFLIVWEGLLGGFSYVNTYDRINREVAGPLREFIMSMNCFGDSIGIAIAGLIAIPVHNLICSLPVLMYA